MSVIGGVDVTPAVTQPDVSAGVCQYESEALIGWISDKVGATGDQAVLEYNHWAGSCSRVERKLE